MEYGPGFVATFLYYFVTTALVATFAASKGLGVGLSTGLPQQLGLLLGLFAGGLGGYFNRTVSTSISFKSKKQLTKKLNEVLENMGYCNSQEDDDGVTVYWRSPLRQLLSGKVFVKFGDHDVTIASRSIHLKKLRRQMDV
ncbi:MAG: hypothetical protein AAFR31_03500 [Cyanobacteria bacterium J06627_8]